MSRTLRDERLQAYHDGELSEAERARVEAELARDPELAAELAALEQARGLLREWDAEAPVPELWSGIAARLPATGTAPSAREAPDPGWAERLRAWLFPGSLAAAVAAASLAVFFFYAVGPTGPADASAPVRFLSAEGASVMVLQEDPDTTIIWLMDGAG
ncbi:MAG: zf-HC2 domain-containing protein [Proteobacteria bacterium]|nr:zf-HC2 domain-containing protein [Pseudomonadota bacterium]